MIRLAVVGLGRMGRAVVEEAERRGHVVTARIDGATARRGFDATTMGDAQVAIEFTRPDAVVGNVRRLIDLGVPVVTGTTGWLDELPAVTDLVRSKSGALLHAANFSIGAHLMFRVARELGRLLATRPEFDAAIHECHHRKKLDAPSGTALALQRAVREGDPARPYPITSERVGSVPGIHTLTIDGERESLSLTHAVRDRATFAVGAVSAAEWLVGRSGVFRFEHVLFGDAS
ncbi:MAG: dihydrodipicolinate reductase C-terminal domain-containing protein [Gemmatimonadales bacterium]|nr:dihydrodipicolinate reductase C-terminal domain-containing protein [Gemmatimonadales bacterium]